MKINTFISQYRRDFRADYECENCGHIEKNQYGYDDRHFHDNVIPNMKCKVCGKSQKDLGIPCEKTETQYEPWEIV